MKQRLNGHIIKGNRVFIGQQLNGSYVYTICNLNSLVIQKIGFKSYTKAYLAAKSGE